MECSIVDSSNLAIVGNSPTLFFLIYSIHSVDSGNLSQLLTVQIMITGVLQWSEL